MCISFLYVRRNLKHFAGGYHLLPFLKYFIWHKVFLSSLIAVGCYMVIVCDVISGMYDILSINRV